MQTAQKTSKTIVKRKPNFKKWQWQNLNSLFIENWMHKCGWLRMLPSAKFQYTVRSIHYSSGDSGFQHSGRIITNWIVESLPYKLFIPFSKMSSVFRKTAWRIYFVFFKLFKFWVNFRGRNKTFVIFFKTLPKFFRHCLSSAVVPAL